MNLLKDRLFPHYCAGTLEAPREWGTYLNIYETVVQPTVLWEQEDILQ